MRAAAQPSRRGWQRWRLRTLLLLFIPLCLALAYYGHVDRQRRLAMDAFQQMTRKGVDANFSNGLRHSVYLFKNGNVTDDDLKAWIPAFNGYAPDGLGRIVKIRLNGSPVSAEAVERFRRAAPECEVEL